MDFLLKHKIENKLATESESLCGDISRRGFMAAFGALIVVGPQLKAAPKSGDVIVVRGVLFENALQAAENAQRIINKAIARLSGSKRENRALEKLLPTNKKYSVKIDCVSPLAKTRTASVEAMLANLFDRGIQPWDVAVWDGRIADVNSAGYNIKTRHGRREIVAAQMSNSETPNEYIGSVFQVPGEDSELNEVRFSRHLVEDSPAIINLPALRHHPVAGFSGALASLAFGAINDAGRFQADLDMFTEAIITLWQHSPLAGHLLTVMDAGSVVYEGGPVGLPGWTAEENALIIGFDPVAVDVAAMQIFERLRAEKSLPSLVEPATVILKAAEEAGIGSSTPNIIHLNAEQL